MAHRQKNSPTYLSADGCLCFVSHGLVNDMHKVCITAALLLTWWWCAAALAKAAHPYGIESFDSGSHLPSFERGIGAPQEGPCCIPKSHWIVCHTVDGRKLCQSLHLSGHAYVLRDFPPQTKK